MNATQLLKAVPRRNVLHRLRSTTATLDQSWSPNNTNTFPTFTPIDNTDQSSKLDLSKHNKEKWAQDDIDTAIKDNSVFSWGASDPLREACIHVDRAEGVYFYDNNNKKYRNQLSRRLPRLTLREEVMTVAVEEEEEEDLPTRTTSTRHRRFS